MSGTQTGSALLEITGLQKLFPLAGVLLGGARGVVRAVDGMSFDVR